MSSISNSFGTYQVPSATTTTTGYDNDGDNKMDFYQKMLVKNGLVALYCFIIDKYGFGDTTEQALKFGLYAGISSDVSDRVAGYIPSFFTLNQASSFQQLLLNTEMLKTVGGGLLGTALVHNPYGRMSQPKQFAAIVFSELLANYMMNKYIHL